MIDPTNHASANVARKLGFAFWKKAVVDDGFLDDSIGFACITLERWDPPVREPDDRAVVGLALVPPRLDGHADSDLDIVLDVTDDTDVRCVVERDQHHGVGHRRRQCGIGRVVHDGVAVDRPRGASTSTPNADPPQTWQTSSGGCCSVPQSSQRCTASAPDVNHASFAGVSSGSPQSCGRLPITTSRTARRNPARNRVPTPTSSARLGHLAGRLTPHLADSLDHVAEAMDVRLAEIAAAGVDRQSSVAATGCCRRRRSRSAPPARRTPSPRSPSAPAP